MKIAQACKLKSSTVALIGFVILLPWQSSAETEVESMVRSYDDSRTQVTSPHLRVKSSIANDSVTVGAGYAMDIITSSSCDVLSWSSRGKISETRREMSGDLKTNLQNGSFSTTYTRSDENDYHSNTISFGATRDFFDKNTTLDLGMSFGDDHVQSSKDKTFDEVLQSTTFSMSLSQVLSRVSLAQVLFDTRIENGYLSSPYRVARLRQSDGTVVGQAENHPRTRNRQSVAAKYNYFVRPWATSFATSLRYYTDSWAVTSYTLEERASREFGKHFSSTVNLRYYKQSAANFFQDRYDSNNMPPFYTGNKTLSSSSSILLGFRPTYRFSDHLEFYAKVEYYQETFDGFTDVAVPGDPNDDKLLVIKAMIYGLGVSGKF